MVIVVLVAGMVSLVRKVPMVSMLTKVMVVTKEGNRWWVVVRRRWTIKEGWHVGSWIRCRRKYEAACDGGGEFEVLAATM